MYRLARKASLSYNALVSLPRNNKRHLYTEYLTNTGELNNTAKVIQDSLRLTDVVKEVIAALVDENEAINTDNVFDIVSSYLRPNIENIIKNKCPIFYYDEAYNDDLEYIINKLINKFTIATIVSDFTQNASITESDSVSDDIDIINEQVSEEINKLQIASILDRIEANIKVEVFKFMKSDFTTFGGYIYKTYIKKNLLSLNSEHVDKLVPTVKRLIKQRCATINLIEPAAHIIFSILSEHLTEILPRVTRWKQDQLVPGLLEHSWYGNDNELKNDANALFTYLGMDRTYCNSLLRSHGLTTETILSHIAPNYRNNWQAFLAHIYRLYRDPQIERIVRSWLVQQNQNIFQHYSDGLAKQHDDIHSTSKFDFNPRYDQYRSNPIIIYRKYDKRDYDEFRAGLLDKKNIDYDDIVVKGDLGSSHGSTINTKPNVKNDLLLNEKINGQNIIWTCGYQVGDIAFLPRVSDDINNYVKLGIMSLEELAKLVRNRLNGIIKVYLIPPSNNKRGGIITRLAQQII